MTFGPDGLRGAAISSTAAGGNWSDTGTWVGGVVPGSGDTVTIVASSVVTVTAAAAASSITLSATSAANNGITISGTNTLTVSTTIAMTAPGAGTVDQIIDVGSGTLSAASITIPGSNTSGRDCELKVGTGGTITTTGNITPSGTAAQAKITFTGTGTINVGGNFGSGGTLTTVSGSLIKFNGGAAQTIGTYTSYNNIEIANTAASPTTVTLTGTTTFGGTLTVSDGLFTVGAFALTVTGATQVKSGAELRISSTTGAKSFGDITVDSGGIWNETVNIALTLAGSFTANGTMTFGTGAHNFTGASKTIGGSASLAMANITITGSITSSSTITGNTTLTVNGTLINDGSIATPTTFVMAGSLTNNGTLTTGVNSTHSGTGTLTQGSDATLVLGDNAYTYTLDASASGNTVQYNLTNNVTFPAGTYHNLTFSSTGTTDARTPAGAITVNGTLTVTTGSTFTYGAFSHVFNGNWVIDSTQATPITATAGSTITFSGTSAQTISGTTTATLPFVNLTISNAAGVTASENITVSGTMTVSSGAFFAPGASNTVAGAGSLTGSGTVKVTRESGTNDFNGQYTLPETLTNLTVDYAGTGQGMDNLTYTGGLKVSGSMTSGTQTATAGTAFTVTGTFTPAGGTITMNNGSSIVNSGVVTFQGLTLAASATVSTSSSFSIAGALSLGASANLSPSSGTITQSGTAWTISNSGTLTFSGWSISGTPSTQPTASFSVGGALTLNGTVTLAPTSGTITLNNGASIVNASGTLTFQNLTLASSASVTGNGNFGVAGTFTVNASATFNPAAANVISGAGTLTGSGTVKVSRTAATADFSSQYTISGKTLTSLTVEYAGSGAAQTISALTYGNLTMNNSSGATLGGGTTINGLLTLTSGNIDTGANTLTLGGSATRSRTSGHVITGSSGILKKTYSSTGSFVFDVGSSNGYSPATINVTGGTLGDFNVSVVQSKEPHVLGTNALTRYWTLAQSGASVNMTADLQFDYLQGDVVGTESNYILIRYNSTEKWVFPFPSTVDTTNNRATITSQGFLTSTNWSLGEKTAATSVELASFTAQRLKDRTVLLQWETGYEVNNLGFHIYRESGGHPTRVTPEIVAGSALGFGQGARLTAGWTYRWRDDPGEGPVLYWLEDIDLDGTAKQYGPFEAVESMAAKDGARSAEDEAGNSDDPGASSPLLSSLGRAGAGKTETVSPGVQNTALLKSDGLTSPLAIQTQWDLAGQTAVKMGVREEGWVRIRQPELVAAGLDPNADPRLLQLWMEGEEVPIAVRGQEDGVLDPGDTLEFYGLGLDTIWSDKRSYWLIQGTGPGKRIASAPAVEAVADAGSSFLTTIQRQDRTLYVQAIRNGDEGNFFGPLVTRGGTQQELTVQQIDPLSQDPPVLEISVQGVVLQTHEIAVALNRDELGSFSFEGQDKGSGRFVLPPGALREGANVVTLRSLAGASDISVVDTVRITYRRRYSADGNVLKMTARGGERVKLGGFNTPQVTVLDITHPNAPSSIEPLPGLSFVVPSAGERSLVAFTDAAVKSPSTLELHGPTSIHTGTPGADLVMIAPPEYLPALAPLKALRESQGLSVTVVNLESVYDEFSFGEKTTAAVRNFLMQTLAQWRPAPRFVILVGDTSADFRNRLQLGELDKFPTPLIDATEGEAASDDWYGDIDLDGVPELAIGRLPAQTVSEVEKMISKLLQYQEAAARDEDWTRKVLTVTDRTEDLANFEELNDSTSFEQAAQAAADLVPPSLSVQTFSRATSSKAELLARLNEGQLMVDYFGHGSVGLWSGLLTAADTGSLTNAPRLPFIASMTCLNGAVQDMFVESLAESLMKAANGGAVAVWASSARTSVPQQMALNRQLMKALFESGSRLTIGSAILRAKAEIVDINVRRTWILFGDPTLRLNPAGANPTEDSRGAATRQRRQP